MRLFLTLGAMIIAPQSLLAFDLTMPGNATVTREAQRNPGSYHVPVGPWDGSAIATIEITGRIMTQALRLDTDGQTTLQILGALTKQLDKAGFETLLRCKGRVCGGFDFRFGTEVLPAPDMFVDLFDYHFLSARRGHDDGTEYVTLLVSRSNRAGFVQIVHAATSDTPVIAVTPQDGQQVTRPVLRPEADNTQSQATSPTLDQALLSSGHAVLADLEFTSGASTLGAGPFASLGRLAAFMKVDPKRRIALVGHTDATGGLDANIALSRKRANAVLERLVGGYDIPRSQLEAGGMGYLSPIASNLTAKGRETNRRVEAVLLNTE